MLSVQNCSKSYGLNAVLKNINFSLKQGERAALVGPNGCGKSTLLNIIAGEQAPDAGSAALTPSDLRIGYLRQGIVFDPAETVGGYLSRFAANLEEAMRALEVSCDGLAQSPQDPLWIDRYEAALKDLTRAQEMEGTRKSILTGFDLLDLPQDTPIETLSGGQKVRLALAGVLLEAPHLLLLDEPTNHLDLEMRAWLQDWVLDYRGAIVLVSHDRAFLDAVIHKIIAFSPSGIGVREYPGNYSQYQEVRQSEFDTAMAEYIDQQEEIKRLKKAAQIVRSQAKFHKGGKADPKNTDGFTAGFFADRSKETVGRAKQLEKRIAYLEGEGALDKPAHKWEMRMSFADLPDSGQIALHMERLGIGYGEKLLLPPITQTVTLGSRIALVGSNGAGKTTLFKTLLGKVPPLTGEFYFGSGVRPGYLSQEQELLQPRLSVLETLQKNSELSNHTAARSFLHRFLFSGDEVFQTVMSLSYGQRSRLMLALLVAQQCNFLLLDEPLNHLDLPSQEAFETALSSFEGTILASAHDRYFIDRFAQVVWHFTPGGLAAEIT
ncbi:MAG TPA: ABC-F family ATP-binding cassette domain-containing protein [Brevefilum sp.]|nr:ABC-F family ATP-binding cassette domain-containing protein [Brevefilum sp.]HOR18958.1 ABC-F family ATP-binding cassette domain-containing protein [Brevefilum sp.]HPL69363.1 ABC-F family ATP-binding cassette domain-containing protein [Brevefilum sp.]